MHISLTLILAFYFFVLIIVGKKNVTPKIQNFLRLFLSKYEINYEKGIFLVFFSVKCVGGWKMQCVFTICSTKIKEHSVEQEGRWQFIGRVESVETKTWN